MHLLTDDLADAQASYSQAIQLYEKLRSEFNSVVEYRIELALIRLLAGWPRTLESAAEAHEPHRIAFFLQELAAQFHLLWTKGKDEATLRFLVAADPDFAVVLSAVRGTPDGERALLFFQPGTPD